MALRKGWIFGYLSLFSNGHISTYYTQGTQLGRLVEGPEDTCLLGRLANVLR
jgi:hypothetical protein